MARKSVAEMKLQQRAIFDMYVAGADLNEIAAHFQMDRRSIQSNLKLAISSIDVTKTLETEMARDVARLEKLFQIFWPYATGIGGRVDGDEPSLDHAKFIVTLLDRKAKLLGLDATKRVDVYHIIEEFAARHGLDPEEVVDVVVEGNLLPAPKDR